MALPSGNNYKQGKNANNSVHFDNIERNKKMSKIQKKIIATSTFYAHTTTE
jgi:hypothetical protein